MLLHVLAHVEANERVLGSEEKLREPSSDLGLADAGGPEKEKRPRRPLRVGYAEPRAPYGPTDGVDRPILTYDAATQSLLHPGELLRLLCLQSDERNAGPRRDHLLDIVGRHMTIFFVGGQTADLLQILSQLDLALPQIHGTIEILRRHRVLHLLHHGSDLFVDSTSVQAVAVAAKLDPGARLVDDVDRLVGLMTIVDESR